MFPPPRVSPQHRLRAQPGLFPEGAPPALSAPARLTPACNRVQGPSLWRWRAGVGRGGAGLAEGRMDLGFSSWSSWDPTRGLSLESSVPQDWRRSAVPLRGQSSASGGEGGRSSNLSQGANHTNQPKCISEDGAGPGGPPSLGPSHPPSGTPCGRCRWGLDAGRHHDRAGGRERT